jgi:hypothetical protein
MLAVSWSLLATTSLAQQDSGWRTSSDRYTQAGSTPASPPPGSPYSLLHKLAELNSADRNSQQQIASLI